MKRIVKILFILSLLLFLFSSFAKQRKSPLATFFPISLFQIESGSMMPEIEIGEIVVLWKNKQYHEQDIITYQVNDSYFMTHRIIKIIEGGYVTKGDFNNTEDEEIVKLEQIQGKVIFHSKLLGVIVQYRFYIIGILAFLWLIE